jgi:fatty-acyl-CoA synthase
MPTNELPHFGQVLSVNARVFADKIGARDLARAMTFAQWNARACRLANALLGLGLRKGDRVAVLAYNCIEWLEIYAGAAKAGLVVVPVNFRLVGPEIRYIVENCGAKAFIVQDELVARADEVRGELAIAPANYVLFGGARRVAGYRA